MRRLDAVRASCPSSFLPPARRLLIVLIPLALGAISSACTSEADDHAPWVLPFDSDEANGCEAISRPFSVANPWDHAHEALDFACIPGTPVLAVAEGQVASVGQVEVRGEARYRVSLSVAGETIRVEYINLRAASVAPADRLLAGDPVGESALGLHVAVWSEREGRYVDPGEFLPLDALADGP
jgi:murein DD-endopeptidase MepM/ murein hydrolase activator NlpD